MKYEHALAADFRKSRFEAHIKGITFGFSMGIFNFAYAVALFYGSRLIIAGELDYANLFKSTEVIIFVDNCFCNHTFTKYIIILNNRLFCLELT